MTLDKRAELIAEAVGRQFDIPFRNKIADLIVIYRSRFLTNSLTKSRGLKKFYSAAIIMQLEKLNKEECEDLLGDCKAENVCKTTVKVPRVLRIGPNPFDYVGTEGGADAYGWTTFATEPYLSANTYTGKRTRYTFLNDYIYVFNADNESTVRVEDVWDDPRTLVNFNCPGTADIPCYAASNDFPIDEATFQLVKDEILRIDLGVGPRPEKQEEMVEIKPDKNV